MTKKNGKPCKKCNTSDWYKDGCCKQCSREYSRAWKINNKQKQAAHKNSWQDRNMDKVCEYTNRWRTKNKDKVNTIKNNRRTRITKAGGSFTSEEWESLKLKYNNKCLRCDKKKPLTVDHVIPVSAGGRSDIKNIQPLCRSCNSAKGTKHTDYRTY
jgi:5-methylcytosine-specific restriction endonuclease McrA